MFLDPRDPRRSFSAVIYKPDGTTHRHSKNLRCLVDYARIHRVDKVVLEHYQDGGLLRVEYNNTNYGVAQFASYAVMVDWVVKRKQMCSGWTLAEVEEK